MKILIIIVAEILSVCSCDSKQTAISDTFNPSIELTETDVSLIGISIGLPKNWEIKYCCVANRDSSFEILRAGVRVMDLKLDSENKKPPMSVISNGFENESVLKEEVGDENMKRSGAIGKSQMFADTELVTTFYYRFYWQKYNKKPIVVEPSGNYTGRISDTCLAIVKPIKH